MAFGPVDPPAGPVSTDLGVNAAIRPVRGSEDLYNVMISITAAAQERFFGGPINFDTDRFSILKGEADERGQIMIRRDSIGEHRAKSGMHKSGRFLIKAWAGCPKAKMKSGGCSLVSATKNKIIVRLPWTFPTPTSR